MGNATSAPVCSDCSSGRAVTDFIRQGWQFMRNHYDANNTAQAKRKNYPVHLAAMPQLRKIGCIDALKILKDEDRDKRFEDSVGLAGDWRKPAPVWDTPYRTLVPGDVDNVLAAGRCIGTLEDAWEIYRVIPVAAMTGEAAGAAAAMCSSLGITPSKLDVKALQKTLSIIRK